MIENYDDDFKLIFQMNKNNEKKIQISRTVPKSTKSSEVRPKINYQKC